VSARALDEERGKEKGAVWRSHLTGDCADRWQHVAVPCPGHPSLRETLNTSPTKLWLSSFFDKEYILISRRYQLHSASPIMATMQCPSDIRDAYSYKKKCKKEKSCYSDQFLIAGVQSCCSKSRIIKPVQHHHKDSNHHSHSPDLGFYDILR
jgi:hypothetical protein